jgi:hypothetical protein
LLKKSESHVIDELEISQEEQKDIDVVLKQLSQRRLLKLVLQRVADSAGFLMEERLMDLLAPYSESQQTIIRLDNVFNVCTLFINFETVALI